MYFFVCCFKNLNFFWGLEKIFCTCSCCCFKLLTDKVLSGVFLFIRNAFKKEIHELIGFTKAKKTLFNFRMFAVYSTSASAEISKSSSQSLKFRVFNWLPGLIFLQRKLKCLSWPTWKSSTTEFYQSHCSLCGWNLTTFNARKWQMILRRQSKRWLNKYTC